MIQCAVFLLLWLSFLDVCDSDETVNSNLTDWSSRRFCTGVHHTARNTWQWNTCNQTRIDMPQCRVKSDRFTLQNICKVTISIRAQAFNLSVTKRNILHVKAITYLGNVKNKTTIATITSKGNGVLQYYSWNFTTNQHEDHVSISFEDRNTGFCGEVRHLSLQLHSCEDQDISTNSTELRMIVNSSQKILTQMTPVFTTTQVPSLSLKHKIEVIIKNLTRGFLPLKDRSTVTRSLSRKNIMDAKDELYYSCQPGYHSKNYSSNNNNNITCIQCPLNTFKKNKGNNSCRRCGNHSVSNTNNTSCHCQKNFFRIKAYKQDSQAACFNTSPRPIQSKLSNDSSVIFSWIVPEKELSTGPLTYRIDCVNCRLRQYFKRKTEHSNAIIKMLETNTMYHFKFSVSYKEPNGSESIIHTIYLSIYIPVDELADDWTFIAVISFVVPIIITAAVAIMLSYNKQKKKNVYFQQKLTSLRRKARPPPAPPLTGTYRIQHCQSTYIDGGVDDGENDEMTSTIKPYAVLNFKSNSLKRNTHKVQENDTETKSLLKTLAECPVEQDFMSHQEDISSEYEQHLSPPPSPSPEGEQYVSMAANNKTTQKKSLNKMSSQRIQNDYIIRPFPVDLNKHFHQMPPLRSRTRSCNIGSQSFLDRSVMEMVNNDRNANTHSQMTSRAGSCYFNTRNQNHDSPRDFSSHQGSHHGNNHFRQAQWTRTNSYYNQNGAWNNSAYFNGPTILPRKSYDNHSYFDEMEHFEAQQHMQNNGWPEAMQGRPRTRSCLVNETRNCYRYDFERNKYQPDFPPFEEMESRSRTESFYNNEQAEMFQAPRAIATPRNQFDLMEKRGRSRTFCAEEPTIDKLSILEQAKLKTKYKRAESKEKLCATDYVKLRRPHSADDVNIVHGMEL